MSQAWHHGRLLLLLTAVAASHIKRCRYLLWGGWAQRLFTEQILITKHSR